MSDKRLAIDLSGLRQSTWRQHGETYGDPLISDHLPESGTTTIVGTSTDKMLADSLTKHMKPGSLIQLMRGSHVDLTPTKHNGCEISGSWTFDEHELGVIDT